MARLRAEPTTHVESLAALVGVAHAVETEARSRYGRLAAQMQRHGEHATAAAFDRMAQDADWHAAAVAARAAHLGQPLPSDGRFHGRLPAELAEVWDEVAGSALLTPYRAFGIAVDNAQRAFDFYTYLAADAVEVMIAREAERLARQKLRHAALLRTWRRAAWPLECRVAAAARPERGGVESVEQLATVIHAAEAEIAACHRLLGMRLHAIGDHASARLLDALADEAIAGPAIPVPANSDTELSTARRPAALLLAAQRPLEQLCERLESSLLSSADEPAQAAAQEALSRAVGRIATLGRRIEQLSASPAPEA